MKSKDVGVRKTVNEGSITAESSRKVTVSIISTGLKNKEVVLQIYEQRRIFLLLIIFI